jgi:transposase-like protein
MRQKSNSTPASSETLVRNIRRATRKRHAAEKIRIVLDGLRGETSIAELCRREGMPRACITLGRRTRHHQTATIATCHHFARAIGQAAPS